MIRSLPVRAAIGLLAGLLASAPAVAQRADYPSRPITMIVPQAVGGTNDIVGRAVAHKLAEELGVGVVVENRVGAGGNIGTQAAAKAPKDGYTVLMTISSTQAINPAVYKSPGFDPVKDFAPVALIGAVPNVLVVNPSFPAHTLDEFLKLARANPGKYPYASAGNGTLNHLLGEMLNATAGVELQHVPYKGVAPALNDVLGGTVPMAFASLPSVLGHLKAGRLTAIGVSSPQRSPALPDVPAIGERVPGYAGTLWIGLFVPRGVPPEVEARLQQAMAKLLAAADTKANLVAQGVELMSATPAQFAALLDDDIARWARIVKASGARID
jgi:tripartite-type tricarboxylate transporter receptor subunit TctC